MTQVPAKFELEQMFLAFGRTSGGSGHGAHGPGPGIVDRVREGADLKAEATLAGAQLQELGAIPAA